MMHRPTIFLTNDDGIASPGLMAAAEALFPLGRLVVAAPRDQQTSMGRACTSGSGAKLEPYPLAVSGTSVEAYTFDGSPAAVVRHALLCIPNFRPALIVAGINYGENIGTNVTGSGTVGATLEGASRGVPGLAMSLETSVEAHRVYTEQDWTGSAYFTHFFAGMILRKGLPSGTGVLKVEVPAGADAGTPWQVTRLSPFPYYQMHFEEPSLASAREDMRYSKRPGHGEPEDTDAYAVRTARVVAVTPLDLDLTASTPLPLLTEWAAG